MIAFLCGVLVGGTLGALLMAIVAVGVRESAERDAIIARQARRMAQGDYGQTVHNPLHLTRLP